MSETAKPVPVTADADPLNANKAENDLITAPIPQLIRRLAIPASVGFFFNTMYNVVDTYWAGRLSTDALAALSLTFPVFFTLISLGSGFSTGATALIGDALGRGDRREAAVPGNGEGGADGRIHHRRIPATGGQRLPQAR